MQQFFQTEHTTEGLFEKLSERLSRLVTAAVNYHSLIQPGRTLHYKVYMGEAWQYPRLTDISTLNGVCTDGATLLGDFAALFRRR